MKRGMSLLIPCFILLAGIAVMLYPKAAEFVNTRRMQEEIDAFESGLKVHGQQADALRQEIALDSWTESVIRMAESNEKEPLLVLAASTVRTDAAKMETSILPQPDNSEFETELPSPRKVVDPEAVVLAPDDDTEPGAVNPEAGGINRTLQNDGYAAPQEAADQAEVENGAYEAPAYSVPKVNMVIAQAPVEAPADSAEAQAVDAAMLRQDVGGAVRRLTDARENMAREALKMSAVLKWIVDQYNANEIDEERLRERIKTEVLSFCITESLSVAELEPEKYAEYIAEARILLGELEENRGTDVEEMFIRLEKAALLNGNRYDMNMAYDAEFSDGGMESVWSNVLNRIRMWRVCLFGTDLILEELLADMRQYNETLFLTGQADLKDPFSYSQASFDLSAYGLSSNIIGYLTIPRMEIELPIYLGANKENMTRGAAHLTETSIPIGGNNTNAVIAAHRGMSTAAMFRNIEKLEIGDAVYITNYWEKLTYRVCEIAIINPSDVESVLIQEDRDMVTLLTCHPYRHNYKRYAVFCERDNPVDFDHREEKDNSSEGAELEILGG